MTRYISLLLMIGCACFGAVLLVWMMLRLLYEMGEDALVGARLKD